jgi:amino acid transporter
MSTITEATGAKGPAAPAAGALRRDAVGVSHIVFFVLAAAAPLTAVVGASPAAFAFGNGAGVPGTYLLVGALYLLFAAGFTAMNRFVGSAGGFYPFIAAGLGKPVGLGGALIALATYNAIDIAVFGLFGFFMADTTGGLLPWWAFALALGLAVHVCGMRRIEFSGRVLGICMAAEILILLVLDLAIVATGGGPEGFTATSFAPATIGGEGLGIGLVFVVASFIGFEATVIFGEEARDPRRTIPIATYVAVVVIACFYAFSTWAITQYYGPSNIVAAATEHTATLFFDASDALLGPAVTTIMNLLLITSLFACALSFHNTINRYFFAIGREGLAWAGLARTHADHQSPHVAGLVQTGLAMAAVILFALSGLDPFAVVFAWMSTFASIGILVMQILVSLSVLGFFRGDSRGVRLWNRAIAPALSGLGLAVCLWLVIANVELVSGSDSGLVAAFPLLILAIGALGIAFALGLRARRPAVYARIGRAFEEIA